MDSKRQEISVSEMNSVIRIITTPRCDPIISKLVYPKVDGFELYKDGEKFFSHQILADEDSIKLSMGNFKESLQIRAYNTQYQHTVFAPV